jgi:ribosome-binding ATPase YchF (GTP1/OBG family)
VPRRVGLRHEAAEATVEKLTRKAEKGFIRAEVIAYDDYVAHRGEQGCRTAGLLRVEGKEYLVQDGDVMHFRFNV